MASAFLWLIILCSGEDPDWTEKIPEVVQK